MRKTTTSLVLAMLAVTLAAAPISRREASSSQPVKVAQLPPAEVASYTIEADYDPLTHQITASQRGTYRNVTDAPIPDLIFHLYLNAFSSETTQWMREAGPGHRGYRFDAAAPGWIRVDEIRLVDGSALTLSPVDEDETLVRAELPAAVAPGESVAVELAYTALLPRVFARTGWADDGDFVMAGQWFPKFGVWEATADAGAWNAYPFRANNEFYADFGTYEVSITLPASWRVGATGTLQGEPVAAAGERLTHRFRAEHVVDFAWSASPRFAVMERTVGGVRMEVLHYPARRALARRVLQATVEGLALFSEWYGPYGGGLYPELTVVVVPEDAGGAGGMEYPTLFTVGVLAAPGLPACVRFAEAETVHELAHQWFQSVIASNEVEDPWLDEGFAEYSTVRAMRELNRGDLIACAGWTMSYLFNDRTAYRMNPSTPMSGRAWELSNFGVAAYAKPAVALSTLERRVGEEAMLAFLKAYTGRHAFTHPNEEDVYAVMAETLGQEIADWFFDELVYGVATLDARVVALEAGNLDVEREGDLCIPVSVALMEREELQMPVWGCDHPFEAEVASLVAAEIDPDATALLDLNLANNGLRRTVDERSWLRTAAGLLQALQILFGGGGLW
jgi:hypothetical protein